ncbi:MAG TPA: 50S ribosomal protein L18e [Candidatus Woesearchaeota archaeon]|nr:50S ribosomal protein L18e [Candidatus Woesearchaeota archaeon]
MKTGPTNPETRETICLLKRLSTENKGRVWKKIAVELERPSRISRAVNLSRISAYTNKGDIALVPGKVLSMGKLSHEVTVVASSFSRQALEKITGSGSKAVLIKDYIKQAPNELDKLKVIG